jgi:hypothetical protein
MKFKKLDYEVHFWVGAIISFVTLFFVAGVFEQSQVLGSVLGIVNTILIAAAKEYYDYKVKKTKFDKKDFWNTVLGGFLVSSLFLIASLTYYLSKP